MTKSIPPMRPKSGSLTPALAGLILLFTLIVASGCGPALLPTPDRSSLAVLPTSTPTEPTPAPGVTLPPRPTDTPSSTPTVTPTPTYTSTPSPTSTPTATPTFTATPGPIANALGFRDPLLDRLDADRYTVAARQTTGSGKDRIVAMIFEPPPGHAAAKAGSLVPRLLIYRMHAGSQPELLFEDEGSDETLQFAGSGYASDQPLGWRDINDDGLLELPIYAANGGYCWACTRVYVLQFVPDQRKDDPADPSIRELTGAFPALNLVTNPIVPKWLNDLDGDGQLEVEALDAGFEFAFGLDRESSPGLYRVLDWNGQRYVDASLRYPGYFDYQIDQARSEVEATYGAPLRGHFEIGKALLVLLAYTARGQRDEGWALFEQLTDPTHWQGEAVEGATALLTAVRDHLRGQYERGEPFASWPPSAPSTGSSAASTPETVAPTPVESSVPAPAENPTPVPAETPTPASGA